MANSCSVDKFTKLPELAKPSLYEINLTPCLETYKLKGTEKIHLDIIKPTNLLKLYSDVLEVEKVSLKLADGTVYPDLKKEIDKKWELLTIHLPKEVAPQKAELDFVFNGELTTELAGFYRSPYKDANGKEKFMASTQFESTYARKAFPCWDEPTYKAQFDVKLEVAENLTALSNTNVLEEKKTGSGTKVITFQRSPLMSTYLVAFAVGEFEYLEAKSKDGMNVRVYTMPGKKETGQYALEVAVKSLDYFSDWFDMKQPLSKCDLISIPEFSMGAMENWGLITFREVALLYDPALTASAVKQRITLVVAHEVGHFWFGNLVTMKWWCDLWLKEGFASFMEFVFTGYNYPEFKIWLHFITTELMGAMHLDSLRNSHPIEVPIENPCELDEIYDSITYGKSNSIIRMLFNYLGEPKFQKGLRTYQAKHKFSNAETKDLWNALSEASDIDVGALMSSWTGQMGFPLITVQEKQLEGNRREIHVQQTRYLADGGKDETNPQWQVPIPVTTSADPTKMKAKFLLTKPEDKFVVEDIKPEEWLKLNSGYTSFIRVRYSDEMFKQLLEGIKGCKMDILDRLQIVADLIAFIRSGHISVQQFLHYLEFCGSEDNLQVWEVIDGGIGAIDHVLGHVEDGGALRNRFKLFVCKVVEPVAARYGWEPKQNEDISTAQLRALLLKRLARSQHQPTIDTALAKFRDYVAKDTELVPDLRGAIFGTAARSNDPKMIADLQNILAKCNFSEIERACTLALGECSDPALLTQIFQKGILEKQIKSQDIIYLFMAAGMGGQAEGQKFAWQFFKDNREFLLKLWGSATNNMYQHCFKACGKSFCTDAAIEEFEGFFKANYDEHTLKTLDRPLRQVVETIKLNAQLQRNTVKVMDDYLKAAGF